MTGNTLVAFAAAALCAGLGATAAVREGRSAPGIAFAAGMAALALRMVVLALSFTAPDDQSLVFWKTAGLVSHGLILAAWIVFAMVFARAEGSEGWSGKALLVSLAVPLALSTLFGDALFAVPEDAERSDGFLPLGWAGKVFFVVSLLLSVAILTYLEATLRASRGAQRWRLKFLLLGVGGYFAFEVYLQSQAVLFSALDLSLEPLRAWAALVCGALVVVTLVRSPGFAERVYVSRAAVYNSVIFLLVGTYLIAVALLVNLLERFGGREALFFGTLLTFLALLGLAALLLSDELRQRLRRFVTQNFARPQYDYRKVWTSFTENTGARTDVHELCTVVARIVSETFGVSAVTLWLRTPDDDTPTLGGSTTLAADPGPRLREAAATLLRTLRERHERSGRPETIDLTEETDLVPEALRRAAEARYVVSLVAAGRLVGVMTLNDRIAGEALTLEDGDLLRTLADQAAANLRNAELSQALAKTREMEAFQTLSAFFIHDLKNLASMLSLTVQNLPKNYDNPDFRRDAFRTISDSVAKMNAMCTQLSTVMRPVELRRAPVDLASLVAQALDRLDGSLDAPVERDLRPVPPLSADADELEKVVVNLLLNARDAVRDGGTIRVGTEAGNGRAALTVADTGCGMTKEFLERSLFEPFRTTKSEGMGIGLFQCRRIVEAHEGRIEVESEEGRGSTFRVSLPLTER